jgi:hypothetical protein
MVRMYKLLPLTLFLCSAQLIGAVCQDPFLGRSSQFILQERLNCSTNLDAISLKVNNFSDKSYSALGDSSYFLRAECVDNKKVMNFLYNVSQNYFVDWSDSVGDCDGIFKINLTCKPETIATLDTHRQTILDTEGHSLAVSFVVYANSPGQTMLAYVLESENAANSVTVRSSDGTLVLSARKDLYDENGLCFANWSVDNHALDPTVAAYILAWKDNSNLSCNPQPQPDGGISRASVALLSIGGTAFVVATGVGLALWKYWPKIRHARGLLKDAQNV